MKNGRVALVVALVATVALARSAAADTGVLDTILDEGLHASQTWYPAASSYARSFYAPLLALDLALMGITWLLASMRREWGLGEAVGELCRRVMLVGLVAAGLTLYPLFVSSIFSTFQKMGATISGTDAVSPSLILDRGILLASAILGAGISSGWAILGIGSLFSVGAALIILLAFALVAARLLEVLLKGYIIVGAGIIFLPFGANRIFAGLAENSVLLVFRTAIQVFILQILVGLGEQFTYSWIDFLDHYDPNQGLAPLLQVCGGAIAFAWITLSLPNEIASVLTSSSSFFGWRDAMRSSR